MKYYVYILQCSDQSFYIGYTKQLEHRLHIHNQGKGAKYTRGRLPVELVYQEVHATQSEAMKREFQLKQLPRKAKQQLVSSQIPLAALEKQI